MHLFGIVGIIAGTSEVKVEEFDALQIDMPLLYKMNNLDDIFSDMKTIYVVS
jgi:hypothetical protein